MKAKKKNNQGWAFLKNPWKIAFLLLVGLILGVMLFFYLRITAVREPDFRPSADSIAVKGDPTFQVQLKKKQVNQIISYYLNDFLKNSGGQYKFYLEDQALLNGTFSVLGHDVQFYLYFDPYVMENGNVQLKAKSLSIGTLNLPISEIMKYMSNSFDLPKWVEIDAKEKIVVLHLDQFKLQNGMYTRAEKINLIDDDIRFNVYLPIEETQK